MEHLGHLKSDDTFNFKSSFATLPACRIDYSWGCPLVLGCDRFVCSFAYSCPSWNTLDLLSLQNEVLLNYVFLEKVGGAHGLPPLGLLLLLRQWRGCTLAIRFEPQILDFGLYLQW